MTINDLIRLAIQVINKQIITGEFEDILFANYNDWTADCLWMYIGKYIEKSKFLKDIKEFGFTITPKYTQEALDRKLYKEVCATLEFTKGR